MDTIQDIIANPHLLVELGQALIAELEKVDILEIALNESIRFHTVAKYNKVYKMGWNLKQCQQIGKELTGYCKGNNIGIRRHQTNDEYFTETNSYPLTAWEGFMKRYRKGIT